MDWKFSLPMLAESLLACQGRPLIQQKVKNRASMVTLSMKDIDHQTIAVFAQVHQRTVHRWVCRIKDGGLLADLARSGRPRKFCESERLTTIAVYCQHAPPLPGVRIWSLRNAEYFLKEHPEFVGRPISRSTIQRILDEHALQPHRRKYYLQITDPDFFAKMETIISLYLHPPENLFCLDECTGIQALNRLAPNLPVATGQPILEDFDYKRNGTTDLIAFLNPMSGTVYGQCVSNHDRYTLIRVFTDHVNTMPSDCVIYYIADNLTTHYHEDFCKTVAELSNVQYKTLKSSDERRQWLASEDKRIIIHFVPFHASWLNMVEIWFGILKNKCLKYDHFFSSQQLCQDILDFIETWNECFAHPFSWSYTGKDLHAKAVRRFYRLLAIETEQMDCKFLKSQLLLMSNIADHYINLIPIADWMQLLTLAVEKEDYIKNIIENDTGPRRKALARQAYIHFVETVINRELSMKLAA